MSTRTKMTAREAFNLNIQDAEMLVELAKLLSNQRVRRMRHELRQRLGDALSVPQKQRDDLECLENERVFVTFKPGYGEWRHRLDEVNLRPLLRQALVAACAAVETFCADRVMERYAATIKEDPLPGRLRDLRLTVGDYLDIQAKYERPGWGLRALVERQVRMQASAAPSQMAKLFALVGEKDLFSRIDKRRGVGRGSSTTELARIVARRNVIAHTGDRSGRGRAAITVAEVEDDLVLIADIVDALDKETSPSFR